MIIQVFARQAKVALFLQGRPVARGAILDGRAETCLSVSSLTRSLACA